MSKNIKFRSLTAILLIVALSLITFAACNAEIGDQQANESTQVSFIPSTSKALNVSGEVQDNSSESVDAYHWKYKCETSLEALHQASFKNFDNQSDADTGLGTIYDLIKGKRYYFALEGWTVGAEPKLVWSGETDQGFKLESKITLVTIKVEHVGKGALYFSVEAPAVTEIVYNDRFVVESIMAMDGTIVVSNTNLEADLDDQTFYYSSLGSDPDFWLDSGSYMVVVKQQTTRDGVIFEDVDARKTIVLVQIASGVNTIVSGSLDSTSFRVLTYEADAAGHDKGMEIFFLTGTDIPELDVTAVQTSGTNYPVLENSRIIVEDDSCVKLVYLTQTDVTDTLQLYVNKTKLNMSSKTDLGFIYDENGKVSHVKNDSETEILAYGKDKETYIITVRYNNLTRSFSIVGTSADPT